MRTFALFNEISLKSRGDVLLSHLLGMVPPSVMASHHRLKPTLTMVLDRKTVNTTRELISRLRKALKMELRAKGKLSHLCFALKALFFWNMWAPSGIRPSIIHLSLTNDASDSHMKILTQAGLIPLYMILIFQRQHKPPSLLWRTTITVRSYRVCSMVNFWYFIAYNTAHTGHSSVRIARKQGRGRWTEKTCLHRAVKT